MAILFEPTEFDKVKNMLVLFNCALKNVITRFDILNEDFKNFQAYNPIEHITSRLKSPESIAVKLHRLGLEVTADNARNVLTDIAGLRCICAYTDDVKFIAETLKRQSDITVIKVKDYITNPKPSGYRSYHMILNIPVFLTDGAVNLPVEVQIRTQAMDFWASLEHKVRYKYKKNVPDLLSEELNDCAEQIAALDFRMHTIHDLVGLTNEKKHNIPDEACENENGEKSATQQ